MLQFVPQFPQIALAALIAVGASGLSAGVASAQLARSGVSFPLVLAQDSSSEGSTSTGPASTGSTSLTRFSCQLVDGEYTIMYNPESQPDGLYAWATPGDMGGGWFADRRCAEVSRRLEVYRPDGLLELRTDVENGYNTVCATTEANGACRIVFTVPQGQDPIQTRDRVFENLAIANQGQDTTAVNTYTGGGDGILQRIGRELGIDLPTNTGNGTSSGSARSDRGIDLRPFLDPADGGTGTALRSSARLDPDAFR
ncbi:MAG: COP23 domain-containing protein [Elainellaceae cyanobacterium]